MAFATIGRPSAGDFEPFGDTAPGAGRRGRPRPAPSKRSLAPEPSMTSLAATERIPLPRAGRDRAVAAAHAAGPGRGFAEASHAAALRRSSSSSRSPASCRASPRSSRWTGTSRASRRPPSRCSRRATSSTSASRTRPGTRSRSASTGCRAPRSPLGEALGVPEARTTIALYRIPSLLGALATVLLTYWAALAFLGAARRVPRGGPDGGLDPPDGRGASRQDRRGAGRLRGRRDGRARARLSRPGRRRSRRAGRSCVFWARPRRRASWSRVR